MHKYHILCGIFVIGISLSGAKRRKLFGVYKLTIQREAQEIFWGILLSARSAGKIFGTILLGAKRREEFLRILTTPPPTHTHISSKFWGKFFIYLNSGGGCHISLVYLSLFHFFSYFFLCFGLENKRKEVDKKTSDITFTRL